jgi:hypothetical protein
MDQVSRSTVVRIARAAALRATHSDAVRSEQRCFSATPTNCVALTVLSLAGTWGRGS